MVISLSLLSIQRGIETEKKHFQNTNKNTNLIILDLPSGSGYPTVMKYKIPIGTYMRIGPYSEMARAYLYSAWCSLFTLKYMCLALKYPNSLYA